MPPTDNATNRPKVLIVAAGLGGLALGMILQKTDTPYEIFERAPHIKPLGMHTMLKSGSINSLTGVTAPLFKQLGIWDEFRSLSKLSTTLQVITAPGLNPEFVVADVADVDDPVKRYGAEARALPRPVLYDLLLRQIPKERIHFGKMILKTQQDDNGIIIAYGAYSVVRQNLYAQLQKESKLPASDATPLPFVNICLVGQTRPLTLEEFPDLAKLECQFKNILAKDRPYATLHFVIAQNTVCYSVLHYLVGETTKDDDAFRDVQWDQEAAQAMCNEVRDFPVDSGREKQLALGDLLDWTPNKEFISKVMLEEMVFQTWSHGHTVLVGDACHKANPAGGSGAINALHDAAMLANYIHALPDHPTTKEIEASFLAYKNERMPWVEEAFSASLVFRHMVDSGWKAAIVRFLMKNMPKWMNGIVERKSLSNRPQLYFLPLDTTPTEMRLAVQPSLHLKRPEQKHAVAE
ncbi:hypothetical protein BG015_002114 [Linnemannia schmuckeri]|uniref:FAD-binding domain-containing protein n=1 Tax=Linnemannia schmuckeri TaxID=64567 RepID=A0A9P5RPF7_9FUNG|nr:hypothetical protein BG015_002114 [Linnemannia schmuckeri]